MVAVRRSLERPRAGGQIACSVRIWQDPHARIGRHYAMPPGEIILTELYETGPSDITLEPAPRSSFESIADLIGVAVRGAGHRLFVVELEYVGTPYEDPFDLG